MSALAVGDRVVLRRGGRDAPGTVLSAPSGSGTCYVRLDGGAAANFPVADLHRVQDKTLPTTGMETK